MKLSLAFPLFLLALGSLQGVCAITKLVEFFKKIGNFFKDDVKDGLTGYVAECFEGRGSRLLDEAKPKEKQVSEIEFVDPCMGLEAYEQIEEQKDTDDDKEWCRHLTMLFDTSDPEEMEKGLSCLIHGEASSSRPKPKIQFVDNRDEKSVSRASSAAKKAKKGARFRRVARAAGWSYVTFCLVEDFLVDQAENGCDAFDSVDNFVDSVLEASKNAPVGVIECIITDVEDIIEDTVGVAVSKGLNFIKNILLRGHNLGRKCGVGLYKSQPDSSLEGIDADILLRSAGRSAINLIKCALPGVTADLKKLNEVYTPVADAGLVVFEAIEDVAGDVGEVAEDAALKVFYTTRCLIRNVASKSSDDGEGCFPGNAMVWVKGKSSPTMLRDLQPREEILVGPNSYEPVYTFGHKLSSSSRNDFMKITVDYEVDLVLTKNHMVVKESGDKPPASSLKVGDKLWLATEALGREGASFSLFHNATTTKGSLRPAKGIEAFEIGVVTSIELGIEAEGLYAPFTPSGMLVVNGIQVSSFASLQGTETVELAGGWSTGISHHWLYQTLTGPDRLFCGRLGWCGNSVSSYDSDGVSMELHYPLEWYKRWKDLNATLQLLVAVIFSVWVGVLAVLSQDPALLVLEFMALLALILVHRRSKGNAGKKGCGV